MKRREEGWIKNIKPYETRTPLSRKSHRFYFREFSGYDYYVDISLFVPLSVVFVLDIAAEALISRVLEEAVGRIARKVAEGKKLSDQEIVILYLDIIIRSNEKRFNDLREYTDKKFESIDRRFEAIDKRFDDLKEYVDKRINDLKDYVDKRFEAVDKRFESLEKRIEDLKGYVDKRLEDVDKRLESLERRVELVYNEVSSIKTDIIKMMKEYMERLYGDKKG
jgi:chaperonin cofactor prefoldin